MLKELSTIATDMLGLEGYPIAPMRWPEPFAARRHEAPAEGGMPVAESEPPASTTLAR